MNVRRTLYWSLTCGAIGYSYGRRGVWGFDAAGTYGYSIDGHWKTILNSKGADNIRKVFKLYSEISWEKLEPDFQEIFVESGMGTDVEKVTAALASDGTFGIAYFPLSRSASINLSLINASKKVNARWFDPTSGESIIVHGSPFKKENQTFTTPGNNSDGDPDWILILTSE